MSTYTTIPGPFTAPQYIAHCDLPKPAYYKSLVTHQQKELVKNQLESFLDTYSGKSSKMTIDGDSVGKALICAFIQNTPRIEGAILYADKQEIKDYMTGYGYECVPSLVSNVIQCVKKNNLAKL